MTIAIGARTSSVSALAVIPYKLGPAAVVTQLSAVIVYPPPSTKRARVSQAAVLVPTNIGKFTVPRTSQVAALIVYTTGTPDPSRSRAWTYTMDGHTFYVLNLGVEGTWVYDTVTSQWSNFYTLGYGQWNLLNGCMWGTRVIGGDAISTNVWELDPAAVLDEGWRDIQHVVTGGIPARSRVSIGCSAVRVSASIGKLDEVNGATMTLTYSDDWGNTFSDPFTVGLTTADYGGEIAYRSLGSFSSPGRIFQLFDVGGLIRIDGCDAFLNGFDNDPQTQASQAEG